MARGFIEMGFSIVATKGTKAFLAENNIQSEMILKVHEGRPNIVDAMKNGDIQLVINTPSGLSSEFDDSYIRKNAIKNNLLYITTTAAAQAATAAVKERLNGNYEVKSLQDYHKGIK